MTAAVLSDIERELIAVTDEIDWKDDFLLVREIDALRNIARKIGAEVELTRLRERESAA